MGVTRVTKVRLYVAWAYMEVRPGLWRSKLIPPPLRTMCESLSEQKRLNSRCIVAAKNSRQVDIEDARYSLYSSERGRLTSMTYKLSTVRILATVLATALVAVASADPRGNPIAP